jgi:protein-S-isoprenylcysteine O-methyltransferase Ste14
MVPNDSTASAVSSASTGALKAPTGALKAGPGGSDEVRQVLKEPARRDFTVRLAELVILLAAILGAIALGLGITEYLGDHPYVSAYIVAYAAFRFADLMVRDNAALSIDQQRFARRVMNELPLLALFFGAPFERTFFGGETPHWLGVLGLLIELTGLWLALGARIQLGFFSQAPNEDVPPLLVRGGLYRYIRHPIYLGEFLVLFAWPFEYAAPVTLVLALIVGIIVIRRRISDDETDMLARFGDEYAAYMRETDAIIPNVW